MSVWAWFGIAGALLLIFRTIALSVPRYAAPARRIGTTTVLTALSLAIVHAVYHRRVGEAVVHAAVAAATTTSQATAATARRLRQVEREEQIERRTPIIRKRLLVAAYRGERGMYEGRVVFLSRCAGCHSADGGGVPDQPRSPAIIGLGERERSALIPYLLTSHPLAVGEVLSEAERVQLEAFLWSGLRDALPAE